MINVDRCPQIDILTKFIILHKKNPEKLKSAGKFEKLLLLRKNILQIFEEIMSTT